MENFEGRPADQPRPRPEGETKEVSLELERSERTVKIRADLAAEVKINLIILIATRKLRPYFDSHTVQVLTNQPLEKGPRQTPHDW